MFGPFFLWGCQKLQLFYLLLVLSLKVLIIRRIGFLENEESNTKLNILCSIYEELKVKGGTVGETSVMKCLMSHGMSNKN
jgi:hypothetical protein